MDVSLINNSRPAQVRPKFTFELVQIMRGFAALVVVGYHCHLASNANFGIFPLKQIFALGLLGVDFFFVLSGFIITYIHLSDLRHQTPVSLFARKRFFRIYPIYWLVALITFAYLVIVEKGKPEHISFALQWNNWSDWRYVIGSFMLFPQPELGLVDVSWTLSFELLFYVVFAAAIAMGWTFARLAFFTWITLILAQYHGVWHTGDHYLNFMLSPLIMEFLMGCLLAYIFREEKIRLTLPIFIVFTAILGTVAFIYLKVYGHHFTRESWNYVLIIGAAVLAIWTCATVDRSRKLAGRNWGILMLLGNASYSIYLIHTLAIKIVYRAANGLFGKETFEHSVFNTNILFFVAALIATVTGIILHLFLEQPLLRYTNRKFISERLAASRASRR
jgi:exopolysaccharide production protein ExoZ